MSSPSNGLSRKAMAPARSALPADVLVAIGCHEDDRQGRQPRPQQTLKLQPVHSWHVNVGDDATRVVKPRRFQQFGAGSEYAGVKTD